jgi:ubiquinone/menaquinone biosynthesis C-methylase UbiE
MKNNVSELLLNDGYTKKNDIMIFSSFKEDEDYWKNENYHLDTENYLLEFLEDSYDMTLEVGAGIGRCTEPLSRISKHIVALEPSLKAIEYSQKRNLKNITYIANSSFELPFKDNSFDLVANITVIEHIPKEYCEQFISEMRRVLKPNGTFIIRNDAWFYGKLEHWKYFDKEPDPTHINMITPKKLKYIIEKVGFEVYNEAYFPFYRYSKMKLPLMDVFATKGNFVCRKKEIIT